MSEPIRESFKLHLPGLLKVLAEHLYSNKQVALRELIQNAHDSALRRRVEGREWETQPYEPHIHLRIDATRRVLTIEDNGFGLTGEEIQNYLATIGRSYTRELRDELAVFSPDKAAELIGQFGFGFLSAFLIASEVTVTTRSLKPGNKPFRWRSAGDEYYVLEELADEEKPGAGTTIELQIKGAASFILQSHVLQEMTQRFADFLPIPIYLGNDSLPINLMQPPWEMAEPQDATRQYIERAFKTEPLCVIPLRDGKVDLGHDTMTIPLHGFLFVPPGSVASVREFGDLSVYIRHMFICENEKDLLPPWARFVRGVIDCPFLQPTASRESLHQDDAFNAVRLVLEEQLGEGLRQIAREQPGVWKQIVSGHTDVITGWAVRDNEFFERVCDIVTFRTSRGAMSLPEYLGQSNDTLYFVTRELGSLQEQLLAEGHGVPVIDASWFAVAPFLEKYASRHINVNLVRLDGEAEELLRLVPDIAFVNLIEYFRRRGIKVRVASFRPHSVPALMIYPQDAEFIGEARRAQNENELPDPLADLVGDYVEGLAAGRDDLAGTLYLNAANDLIRRLNESQEEETREAALNLIFQIARLFSGRTLTAADAGEAFGDVSRAVGVLALRGGTR